MRVFAALLLDAYRELNSRRLFWITLVISGTVVLGYGSLGFDEDGMSLFFGLWNVENPLLAEGSPMASMLYRSLFSSFIVGIWLAWIATILALISTTTIFPDFVSGGSIDLVLSKPIGRTALFAMKYLASLLFVLLQVSLFCVGIFLCIGLRTGEWEWLVFAAIPVVTVFYSYLFAINVLVGVWTRSALTALLVTMMFWFSLFSLNMGIGIMDTFRTRFEMSIEEKDDTIGRFETALANFADADGPTDGPARERIRSRIEEVEVERDAFAESLASLDRWYRPFSIVQAILPKTSETIALLDRWLVRSDDVNVMDILSGNVEMTDDGDFRPASSDEERDVMVRMDEELRSRSILYVMGTSVAFEAVVLALAALVFVRRDY